MITTQRRHNLTNYKKSLAAAMAVLRYTLTSTQTTFDLAIQRGFTSALTDPVQLPPCESGSASFVGPSPRRFHAARLSLRPRKSAIVRAAHVIRSGKRSRKPHCERSALHPARASNFHSTC